jgi:hypothetical protein
MRHKDLVPITCPEQAKRPEGDDPKSNALINLKSGKKARPGFRKYVSETLARAISPSPTKKRRPEGLRRCFDSIILLYQVA